MTATCSLCGGRARRLRTFATLGTECTDLWCCQACGTEFLSRQPSDAWLAREYAAYYTRREATVTRPKRDYFSRILHDSGVNFAGQTVLDVGTGEGDCVAAINRDWPDARPTFLETNANAARQHADLEGEWVCQDVETWLRTAEARYDAILLFDVLEHLRQPLSTLKELVATGLKPGGLVVATFPSASSLSRALLGRFWPQYKVEHLFYFSEAGVAELAARSGLETLLLRGLRKTLPLDYFLAVGSNFGPALTRPLSRAARRLVPACLRRRPCSLWTGEWHWVARRRTSS